MSTAIQLELAALREGSAIAPLPNRAFLRITGPDSTRWLNGMVTNNITALAPGEGNYNFLLNAQGRIQGDCTLYREAAEPSTFLLETDTAQLDTIHHHLDRFIIMDDVEITEPVPALTGMLLLGPSASHPLTSAADCPLPALGGHASRVDLNGHEALVLTPQSSGTPAYEVWFDSAASAEYTFHTFKTAVGTEASAETLEALRILEGRPKFGQDIRDRDLPQETAQTHALHFSKGCYLGQEIVERIHSRGQVHRTFTQFRLTGTLPETLPASLESNSKPAGELTSAALIPLPKGPTLYALGYIRRELLDSHAPLTYPGGTAFASNPSTHSSQPQLIAESQTRDPHARK